MKAGESQRDERCSYTHTSKENPKFQFGKGSLLCVRRSTQPSVLVQVNFCKWRVYILPHISSGHIFVFCLTRWVAAYIRYSLMQGWAWLWQAAFALLLSMLLYLCMCVWGTSHKLLSWRVRGDGSQMGQIEVVRFINYFIVWGTDPWKAWRFLTICWSKPLETSRLGVLSRWS